MPPPSHGGSCQSAVATGEPYFVVVVLVLVVVVVAVVVIMSCMYALGLEKRRKEIEFDWIGSGKATQSNA